MWLSILEQILYSSLPRPRFNVRGTAFGGNTEAGDKPCCEVESFMTLHNDTAHRQTWLKKRDDRSILVKRRSKSSSVLRHLLLNAPQAAKL